MAMDAPDPHVAEGLAEAIHGIAVALGVELRDPDRLAYSPTEVGHMLGLGEEAVRKLVASGDLHAVQLRRRILIPRSSVLALLDGSHRSGDVEPVRPRRRKVAG